MIHSFHFMILNFNKQSFNENAMVKYIQDNKTLLKMDCFRKVPNFIFKLNLGVFTLLRQ